MKKSEKGKVAKKAVQTKKRLTGKSIVEKSKGKGAVKVAAKGIFKKILAKGEKKPSGKIIALNKNKSKETAEKLARSLNKLYNNKPKKAKGKKSKSLKPEYLEIGNGRPTKYTKELGERICREIATTTNGLQRICEAEGMPCVSTIYNWLNDKERADFLEGYTRAREMQGDLLDGEIIEIADNNKFDSLAFVGVNFIQRAKLMIDARKWKAAHLNPKKYGAKLDVTSDGGKLEAVQIFIPDNGRDKN